MPSRFLFATALVLAFSLITPLTAGAETTLVERKQTIFFAQGCETSAATCDTTEYLLSRAPGTSSIGNLAHALSVPWRTATGDYFLSDTYSPDSSLDDSYLLVGGSTIEGQIQMRGQGGNAATVAVLATIEVELSATEVGGPGFGGPSFSATVTKQVVAGGDTTYEFSLDVPDDLDGVEVTGLTATVSRESFGNDGYVDGVGESYLRLPYYEEVEVE